MFKQGICVNFQKEGAFEACKNAGADFVELNYADMGNQTDGQIREIRDRLSDLGLVCLGYNGMFPWNGMKVTGEQKDYGLIDEYLHARAEKLACMGSKYVVFGSHGARKIGGDNTLENATEELVVLLHDHVAPIFRKAGLVCAIEPLSVDDLVHTVADGARLTEMVNQPEIRLLADTFHMYRNGETYEDILPYGHLLSHVHIGEGANRFYPAIGDGMEYEKLISILRQVNYQGVLSVEADLHGEAFSAVALRSMEALRHAQA